MNINITDNRHMYWHWWCQVM